MQNIFTIDLFACHPEEAVLWTCIYIPVINRPLFQCFSFHSHVWQLNSLNSFFDQLFTSVYLVQWDVENWHSTTKYFNFKFKLKQMIKLKKKTTNKLTRNDNMKHTNQRTSTSHVNSIPKRSNATFDDQIIDQLFFQMIVDYIAAAFDDHITALRHLKIDKSILKHQFGLFNRFSNIIFWFC